MNKCSVENCFDAVRAKGLCSKHYERKRVHGNTCTDLRATGRKFCAVINCLNLSIANELCTVHYARKFRHGDTNSRQPFRGKGVVHEGKYIRKHITGRGYVFEHVLLAEKALGKLLPSNAVVHHMNEKSWDNKTLYNLIVCENQSYHMLLHKRMKEFVQFGKCFSTELGK